MSELLRSDRVGSAVSFDEWIGGRRIQSIGTNAGADVLPFQAWRNFKEAFAPELIQRAVSENPVPVNSCLDPFGGSGTTALACQFLGVRPVTIEVNPYLADLIEAKLTTYKVTEISRDFATLVRVANRRRINPQKFFANAPATFVQPGVNDRWLFDTDVAARLAAYVASFPMVENRSSQRLLRVLLGGVLVELSNVIVSGKGRRYRRSWKERILTARDLDEAFCEAVEEAVGDILRYETRVEQRFTLRRGDARRVTKSLENVDLAVFSPPYPNSFDYTDVYNVELWGLQYLRVSGDNLRLRQSTPTSHVQIKRRYSAAPSESRLLSQTLRALSAKQGDLWNKSIPAMIGGYFGDMVEVIKNVAALLPPSLTIPRFRAMSC